MYAAARALRAFRDAEGTDEDWIGAMLLADGLDNLRILRALLGGALGVKLGKKD
jgi:hypothetical protein